MTEYSWIKKCMHVTCNILNQSLLTFALINDGAIYYWTKKCMYSTCKTSNHNLDDVFHSIRACHLAESCASELFLSDGHDLPIVFK